MHFENADREAPSPEALRAAIRARRDAQQLAKAATLAELALRRYPDKEEVRTFANSVLLAAKDLARVEISCKPACELVLDAKLVHGEAATQWVLYVEPGRHTVSAGWGEKAAKREFLGSAGETTRLSFVPRADMVEPAASVSAKPVEAAKASAAATSRTEPQKNGFHPAVFYTGIGLTVLLAGATVWSGIDTNANPGRERVKAECVGQGESCKTYRDGLAKQNRTNLLLGLSAGAAVATALVGVLMTDWGRGKQAESGWVPVLEPASRGAAVGARARF